MNWIKVFFEGRAWLLYGSIFGGIFGTLATLISFQISPDERMLLPLPLGIPSMVGLGMIGGVIGGMFGSFAAGVYVHENLVFNIGVSLGVGLINGFIVGIILGFLLGCANLFKEGCISNTLLIGFLAISIIVAVAIYLLRSAR